jgi:hypothetical protein
VGDGIDKSYAKADDETDSKSIDSSRSAEDEEDEEVCFFTISSHKIKFSLSLSPHTQYTHIHASFVIECPSSTSRFDMTYNV